MDDGSTVMQDAVKYGKLSIRSLSKNGKMQPRHCRIALPNATSPFWMLEATSNSMFSAL